MSKSKDEIEAKFRVLGRTGEMPFWARVIWIVQTYLRSPKGQDIERRLRSCTENGRTTYFYAEKWPTPEVGKRKETEPQISWFKYAWLYLTARDWKCFRIKKKRHAYQHDGRLCEHDIYDGRLKGFETIEIEVGSVEELENLSLPDNVTCINVTGDKRYSNRSLAEHGIPTLES